MIFIFYLAFAAELVALGVGFGFLVWAYRREGRGVGLAKVAGFIITITIAVMLLGTLCTGLKYWKTGYYQKGHCPMMYKQKMQTLTTPRTQ